MYRPGSDVDNVDGLLLVAIRLAGDDVLTRREEKEWPALLFSFATQQHTTHNTHTDAALMAGNHGGAAAGGITATYDSCITTVVCTSCLVVWFTCD
jgi:hypothetical protein